MKKSVLINVLVITTVLAFFVFIGIWYFRPAVSNEMLEEARQRQLTPLLEIDKPARLSGEQTETTETALSESDRKLLAEQLLPDLKDDLSASLETELYGRLSDRLSSDSAFADSLADSLEPILTDRLRPQLESALASYRDDLAENRLPAALEKYRASLEKEFVSRAAAEKADILASAGRDIEALRDEGQAALDGKIEELKQELSDRAEAYLPQLVDTLIPEVTARVFEEIEANKADYLAELAGALKPYISESPTDEQVVALYESYRDRLVADIVPAVLDALQQPISETVRQSVESMTVPQEREPAPAVPPVAKKPTVSETVSAEGPAVPKTPAAPVLAAEPTVTVTAPQPVIAVPKFAEHAVTVFMDPETYRTQRDAIRSRAIQAVLDRLEKEN